MDGNERLLSRVLEERSSHGRARYLAPGWMLLGGVVLVVAIGVSMQLVSSHSTATLGVTPSTAARPAPTALSQATSANQAAEGRQAGQASAANQPTAVNQTPAGAAPRVYIVQPGDSLESIAARNDLTPSTLASVNQLDNPDLLQPGRELVIPSTDGFLHVVAPGETLRSIAEKYNVDVSTLAAANAVRDPDHITAGLRLFIPVAH